MAANSTAASVVCVSRPPSQRGMSLLELSVVLLVLVALAGLAVPYVGDSGQRAACQTTDATLAAVRDAVMGSGAGAGYVADMGDLPFYLDGAGNRRDTLHFLFAPQLTGTPTYYANGLAAGDGRLQFNPNTGRGWHGPYLQGGATSFHVGAGFPDLSGQSAVLDGFIEADCGGGDCRSPVVLQVPTADDNTDNCPNVDVGSTANQVLYARLVSAGPDGVLNTAVNDADACVRGDDRVLFLRVADPGRNAVCGAS